MKRLILCIAIATLLLTGCSKTPSQMTGPTSLQQETSSEESDSLLQAPALSPTDNTDDLTTDLQNTEIAEETF